MLSIHNITMNKYTNKYEHANTNIYIVFVSSIILFYANGKMRNSDL